MCQPTQTKDELIQLAAENVAAVIDETRPRGDQLVALLASEIRKVVDEEFSYWYGIRAPKPHPIRRGLTPAPRTRTPDSESSGFG